VLLHYPDAGPDTSSASACMAVRESAENGQNQNEEEHARSSDAWAWIPAHMAMN
jgi:hypothetical protein